MCMAKHLLMAQSRGGWLHEAFSYQQDGDFRKEKERETIACFFTCHQTTYRYPESNGAWRHSPSKNLHFIISFSKKNSTTNPWHWMRGSAWRQQWETVMTFWLRGDGASGHGEEQTHRHPFPAERRLKIDHFLVLPLRPSRVNPGWQFNGSKTCRYRIYTARPDVCPTDVHK